MTAPPAAVVLGSDMAYDFVECDGRLFAAVPRCSPGRPEIEICRRESSVEEYVLTDGRFRREARHAFFGPTFAGRIEQLACLGDRVGLGMDWTLDGETVHAQSHLEFDPRDPSEFRLGPLGEAAGDGVAYDAKRRRAYYTSDRDVIVVRDLETDTREDLSSETIGVAGPSDVKYHAKRDAVYALGYYSTLVEIDGEDHGVRRSFSVLNPWEMVIDEELDRIYVAGSFGLEVVDLERGETIARRRLGLGGRRPAFDPCNQVIYVPTTAGGRLFAYDRLSLAHLGDVPLGPGIRYPYVMESGDFLLATNNSSHFAFDSRKLAAHLRRGEPAPAPGSACPWDVAP